MDPVSDKSSSILSKQQISGVTGVIQGNVDEQQKKVHTWAETGTGWGNPEFIPMCMGKMGGVLEWQSCKKHQQI